MILERAPMVSLEKWNLIEKPEKHPFFSPF
jgi:hypothetical protein